ncbi:CoA transferase [Streptomyces sp. NPDC050625]|uniref:CaiB/BaiF CoA transferase family protein n=1 Tax=Streptomyces sp. NPDC050625 TaxID=3154629 RepID=UPI00343386CB
MSFPTGLLDGVRVIDLTKATSGPFGTQILADLGAEVLKIEEPPTGTHARDVIDAQNRIDDMDSYFLCVNRSKRSVAIKLGDPEGLKLLYALVAKADVVVNNYRPGVAKKLGVDYDALKKAKPQIILCELSAFGATGDYRFRAGFDISVQGASGVTEFCQIKDEDGIPQAVPVPMADLVGGMYVAVAVPAALHRRATTGEGCRIDIAMNDSLMTWMAGFGVQMLNFPGTLNMERAPRFWGTYATADKPLTIAATRRSQFERFCRILGHPEWLEDPRFAEPKAREENFETLRSMATEILRSKTSAQWIQRFEEGGLAYSEVLTPDEAFAHPQTAAREMVVEVKAHSGKSLKLLGNPIKVDGVEQRYVAPPHPGMHTGGVLADLLGLETERLDELQDAGVVYLGE